MISEEQVPPKPTEEMIALFGSQEACEDFLDNLAVNIAVAAGAAAYKEKGLILAPWLLEKMKVKLLADYKEKRKKRDEPVADSE